MHGLANQPASMRPRLSDLRRPTSVILVENLLHLHAESVICPSHISSCCWLISTDLCSLSLYLYEAVTLYQCTCLGLVLFHFLDQLCSMHVRLLLSICHTQLNVISLWPCMDCIPCRFSLTSCTVGCMQSLSCEAAISQLGDTRSFIYSLGWVVQLVLWHNYLRLSIGPLLTSHSHPLFGVPSIRRYHWSMQGSHQYTWRFVLLHVR